MSEASSAAQIAIFSQKNTVLSDPSGLKEFLAAVVIRVGQIDDHVCSKDLIMLPENIAEPKFAMQKQWIVYISCSKRYWL